MEQQGVIYARISDDQRGEGLGVERQIADCQELTGQWAAAAV
jgi:hypothetical protein